MSVCKESSCIGEYKVGEIIGNRTRYSNIGNSGKVLFHIWLFYNMYIVEGKYDGCSILGKRNK